MPQSGQKENENSIEHGPVLSFAIAAQRDVHIQSKPRGQGYMPATPKVLHGGRNIRIIEILFEMKSEHFAHPDRHIRISGKVEVNLKKVSYGCDPSDDSRYF